MSEYLKFFLCQIILLPQHFDRKRKIIHTILLYTFSNEYHQLPYTFSSESNVCFIKNKFSICLFYVKYRLLRFVFYI